MEPISVPLRLDLTGLQEDTAKAVTMLQEQLGKFTVSIGVAAKAAGQQMDRDVADIARAQRQGQRFTAKQISDLDKISSSGSGRASMKGWMGAKLSPAFLAKNPELAAAMSGQTGDAAVAATSKAVVKQSVTAEEKAKKAIVKANMDRANFMRDISFLMMPLVNPASPWGMLFSTRQTFSAFTHTQTGRNMSGGTVGGAAWMTAALVAGATAAGVALKALTVTVQKTVEAYGHAGREYARALTSGGLPLGFTVRRAQLASVMGVSEKEVFQFGRQVMYLTDKLRWSGETIARTTPQLTKVNWEFRVMIENLKAVAATIAEKFGPALSALMEHATQTAKSFSQSPRQTFNEIYPQKLKQAEEAQARGMTFLNSHLPKWYMKIINAIFPHSVDKAVAISARMAADKSKGGLPPPTSYMKQLPVSSWERMGLVVGGGVGINHSAETARNTRQTVQVLRAIQHSIIPRSGMQFFNPAVSNP